MQIKSHDFPNVYEKLGINLSKLGCVMVDIEPIHIDHWLGQDGVTSYVTGFPFYTSENPERFWIKGYVANKTPHVTLLYGLLEQAQEYAPYMDTITISHFDYFESPYEDEEYYCIVGHVLMTPELAEGHQRLELLPHINTFAGYKPHVTIAYIKKDEALRDSFIEELNNAFGGKTFKIKKTLNLGGNK